MSLVLSHSELATSRIEKDVLFKRDFILLLISVFFFVFSIISAGLAVPLFLRSRGHSNAVIGIVLTLPVAIAAFLRPFAGRGSDSYGRKVFLLIGSFAAGSACILYAKSATVPAFFLASLCMASGFASFDTSSYALAGDLAPRSRRVEATTFIGVSWGAASILAPLLVLVGRQSLGFSFVFTIAGCAGALAFTAALLVRNVKVAQAVKTRTPVLKMNSMQRAALLPVLLFAAFSGLTGSFLVLSARKAGIPYGELFFTVSGAVVVSGRILGRKLGDRHSKRSVIVMSGLGISLTLVIISFAQNLSTFILCAVLSGLSTLFLWPATTAFLLDHTPVEERGMAIGRNAAVFDVAFGGLTAALAPLADLLGYQLMYLTAVVLMLTSIVLFMRATKNEFAEPAFPRGQQGDNPVFCLRSLVIVSKRKWKEDNA